MQGESAHKRFRSDACNRSSGDVAVPSLDTGGVLLDAVLYLLKLP